MFPSNGLGLVPGNLSQNGRKPTPLMMLLTKKPKAEKFLFHCTVEDLLHLLSSVAQLVEELHRCTVIAFLHFERQGTIYLYFEIGLKPAVVSCLTNAIAPPLIALDSCSRAQADWPVF